MRLLLQSAGLPSGEQRHWMRAEEEHCMLGQKDGPGFHWVPPFAQSSIHSNLNRLETEKKLICYWKIICSCFPGTSEKHPRKFIYHLEHNPPTIDRSLILKPFLWANKSDADKSDRKTFFLKKCRLWIMKLREFPSSSSQTANNGQRKRTFAIIQCGWKGRKSTEMELWGKWSKKREAKRRQKVHNKALRGNVKMTRGGFSLSKLPKGSGSIPSLGGAAFQTLICFSSQSDFARTSSWNVLPPLNQQPLFGLFNCMSVCVMVCLRVYGTM